MHTSVIILRHTGGVVELLERKYNFFKDESKLNSIILVMIVDHLIIVVVKGIVTRLSTTIALKRSAFWTDTTDKREMIS